MFGAPLATAYDHYDKRGVILTCPCSRCLARREEHQRIVALSKTEETLCTVRGDFNYARRKAPPFLRHGGDGTLISSIWEKVPQMFVMRWLLAAADLCDHGNQPTAVCHSGLFANTPACAAAAELPAPFPLPLRLHNQLLRPRSCNAFRIRS